MGAIKHLTRLSDFTIEEIKEILERANRYASGEELPKLEGKVIANLFFEPSTRTQYSFMMAEQKLGLQMMDFTAETSSVQKGETLYDTVKTFEAIGVDGVVIRHPQNNYFEELIPHLNSSPGVTGISGLHSRRTRGDRHSSLVTAGPIDLI